MSKRSYIVKRYRDAVDFASSYLAAYVVDVYYYTGEETDCSGCDFDPINNESTNPNCELCSGVGKVKTMAIKKVNANVSWLGISDQYARMQFPPGTLDVGDAIASCKLSEVLLDESNTAGQTYFDIAEYVMVNNWKCEVYTTPLRYGLAGDLYRCAVVLKRSKESH